MADVNKKSLPGYRKLLASGELELKVEKAKKHWEECSLCPHQCKTQRETGGGACHGTNKPLLASYGPHFGEEGPLVGRNGSGTIFFAYCNLDCVFCQNYELSHHGRGRPVTSEDLAGIMLKLQRSYLCHNINLVTPTHFVPSIIEAVALAAEEGLELPLVYNCGGYESLATLELLDGIVDIYMPDFKYAQPGRGEKYSKVKDYPQVAKVALKEMDRQVGGLQLDEKGVAYKGLLIRHLVLPQGLEDTKEVLDFIKAELSPDCLVNLMDQYYPAHQAHRYEELSQRLPGKEYREAYTYAKKLGLRLAL